MKRLTAWTVAALLAGLGLAGIARGDVVIHLKNGVEVRVPVSPGDVSSITFEQGGKPAAQVQPAAPPKQAEAQPAQSAPAQSAPVSVPVKVAGPSTGYDEAPLSAAEMKEAASGPALPGASEFRGDAFAKGGADQPGGSGRIVHVGKGKEYQRFGDVASSLQSGDVVEIEGGLYLNDFAEITASNITIRGVHGRPHFRASVEPPNAKAMWVISGDNVTVDNIEISGVSVPDDNGAAIRAEGGKLVVKNCYFHHNQFGFLSANGPEQEITIANSEIAYNLRKDNYAHGIYIGHIRKFTLIDSYVHHNHRGHEVKSRAAETLILYNRLTDEDGVGSYLVDAPNCGNTYIIGNVLQKGANAENYTAIAYGAEGCKGAGYIFYVGNNTYVNSLGHGPMVKNHSGDVGLMQNNLIVGADLYQGSMNTKNNLQTALSDLVNPAAYDYRLKAGSAAIDAGAAPGKLGGVDLTPASEYVQPMKLAKRPVNGRIDIGAYEYTGK